MNYLECIDDDEVFGRWYGGGSWANWRVIERAIFGLPIPEADMPLFRDLTGREEAPDRPAKEIWVSAGRRSGKSRKAATIAVFLSTIGAETLGYRQRLAPGERAVVLLLATDKAQAKVTLDYARAIFDAVPMFKATIERSTGDGLELNNKMSLMVVANDFRSIRGRTLAACIFDETAFWRNELTSNPDLEVYRAVKPALASMPNSLLIGISSPYRRAGLLWSKFKRHWGKPGSVLVIKASTELLNPNIDREEVAEAYADDPEAARAEFGAEFRTDIADFVPREVVEALVSPGVFERLPVRGARYSAFTDPSGGSADSFTVAICHREKNDVAVLDAVRERKPPFSPEQVVEEFSGLLGSYGVREVVGDRYGGEWPSEQFRKRGITYRPSECAKSEIYLESLPLLNGGRVDLLDNDRLVAQICGLERRTARGGRDTVDHAPGARDDLANSALGAARLAVGQRRLPIVW